MLRNIKKLNEMGCETSIKYSQHTKKWYVSTRAEIMKDGFLIGIARHEENIDNAIVEFNHAINGKRLLLGVINNVRLETILND